MRDLKNMIEFEDLLLEAHNDLVRQAKDEGKLALGYTCYFMPEVLLNLPGCFSVRLRAPRSASPDMATYYMSGRTCMYGRALMERALEGGFNFLDAQLATETCTVTCRFQEHMQMMPGLINNPNFFCEFTDVPFKKNDNSILHYKDQLQAHVLDVLHEKLGVDTSDEAIRKAIEEQNEINRVIREIGEFRKLDNPTITGFEFALCQLVAIACPHYLILPKLKETLEDLKTRKPDPKPGYRIKVVVAGSENDDPYFIQLIEECGARVVADRYCYGSIPGREEIEIKEGETALEAVARHYLQTSMCTRFMEQHVMRQRKETLAGIVKEYKADGIIIEQMKFCEYWSYERMIDTFVLRRDYGIPVCSIEKEYNNGATGQLRTRFQAFIESVELKKLQSEKAERGVG
ncbi:MAG: 2-hydroxyacyl-CoA dehydratase [Clostridia bacterium]|nr:2-hydroxyacyl-CoA dehydratase [Clostridia bacterium]MBQ1314004.1 2-hydroxyacyl-CoA dehydratase [Clostridia bacterium]MBQ1529207.1 2-hydroxyacyl-CoA dehydratase [Clostridia bacterium]MBQ1706240.1 2-hydroxyacyl-CoA dehydratase [Clostridia bacterium]MBQ5580641.1 2-hydroxyacyl-CoA dehydratase [Clostridia bacterium]